MQVTFVICCNCPQIVKAGGTCLCSCKVLLYVGVNYRTHKSLNASETFPDPSLLWPQILHSHFPLFKKLLKQLHVLLRSGSGFEVFFCPKYQQFHYSVESGAKTFGSASWQSVTCVGTAFLRFFRMAVEVIACQKLVRGK